MRMLGPRALVMAAGLMASTGQVEAAWVIDQVSRGTAGEGRQQVTVAANRVKVVTLADGKPASAYILDLDAQTITTVEYGDRQYRSATVQEFVQLLQGSNQTMGQQMEEAMRSMPPEQRRMVEEMMRRQGMPAAGRAEACPEPRAVEVRRTAERQTIAGYPAVRYDVLADGQLQSEVWVAAGITAWRGVDRAKLERFGMEMSKLAVCGQGRAPAGVLGTDEGWKLAGEGYPVRTTRRGGGATEVVKAEERAVPASEFEPPAGFTRSEMRPR